MIEGTFKSEVLETEIVVAEEKTGHIFRFPVLSNGTVSLQGAKIEANPAAERAANRLVFAAHEAAQAVYLHYRAQMQK